MEKLNVILFSLLLLSTSCTSRLGDLTTISTRNIDSKTEYTELARYVKGNDKVLTSIIGIPIYKRPNFEEATDNVVAKVPSGEYLKNATLKSRLRWWLFWSTEEIVVTGDVWGKESNRTLKVGSKVKFVHKKKLIKGEIINIDGSQASIKYNSGDKEKVIKKELAEISVSQ